MKKRNFKSLILNKKSISLIGKNQILAGLGNANDNDGDSSDPASLHGGVSCDSCNGPCGDWD